MNVLVIPEDFRKDQYVLRPIVSAMLKSLGQPSAVIRVCQDPLLGGIGEALKIARLVEIIERYRTVDLFLLCVDRDGDANRQKRLIKLEQQAAKSLAPEKGFLAENAWQEIEVWLLAGHDLPNGWKWTEVRQEVNPKEVFFTPFARSRGLTASPYEGRKMLAYEAASRYDRIRRLCPDDVQKLESRIADWLGAVK